MLGMLALFVLIHTFSVNAGHPYFDKTVEKITLEAHVKVQILCNASGDEPMEYTWYDEHSQEVGFDHDHFVYTLPTDEMGSYLVMEDPLPNHNESFTCSAKNVHGRSSKIFEVFFLQSESPVIRSVSILNISESSVIFSVFSSRNTQSILINYKEDQDKISKSSSIPAYGGKMSSAVQLDNLVPGGKYRFTLQAVSGNDTSSPWVLNDVILLPSPPELIFLRVGDGSLKIQWLKKFDDFRRETILDYTLSYGPVYMRRGNDWEDGSCQRTNITLPTCGASSHTISDLSRSTYYEVQVRARTTTGFGEPSKFKVYVP